MIPLLFRIVKTGIVTEPAPEARAELRLSSTPGAASLKWSFKGNEPRRWRIPPDTIPTTDHSSPKLAPST